MKRSGEAIRIYVALIGTVTYHLPTLHNRDYETMLLAITLETALPLGPTRLGTVTVTYTDLTGTPADVDPIDIEVEAIDEVLPW